MLIHNQFNKQLFKGFLEELVIQNRTIHYSLKIKINNFKLYKGTAKDL